MSKITLAALIAAAAVGTASPAFSQAFNPGYGGGNVQPFFYAPVSPENSARVHVRAARTHELTTGALGAFASEAPQPNYSFNSVSPSATGGGSIGYNEHLYEAD